MFVCAVIAMAFPRAISAACGFWGSKPQSVTQPALKAFITWNPETKIESITLQPRFESKEGEFVILIPTPAKPTIEAAPADIFKDLATYTQLMPLPQPIATGLDTAVPIEAAKIDSGTVRFGPSLKYPRKATASEEVVGNVKFQIYGPDETAWMFDQLKAKAYTAAGDLGLREYARKKWYFTFATIDAQQLKKSENGVYPGEVAPVRISFSSEQCVFPIRILQSSLKENMDILMYVQAPQQMDVRGDLSWMHAHRLSLLTYMLGTGATQEQQQELQQRTQWITAKLQDDRAFQSTKLEYARPFGEADAAMFDDPHAHFARSMTDELPPGAAAVSTEQFIKGIREEYESKNGALNDAVRAQLQKLEERYATTKGLIVKMDPKLAGKGFVYSRYMWYPGRDVPEDNASDIQGLTRLKGTLQRGQWLTKIHKVLRTQETHEDWVLAPVEKEHPYVRMLPTSPP